MTRIDVLLVSKNLAKSRTAAAGFIKEGRVKAEGKIVNKPSELFDESCAVTVKYPAEYYVSRGGYKLAGAFESFGIDVTGRTCLDIGASTGGFTDCLLRHGAIKVYAVDSGTAQLDKSLKSDPRVISLEQTNARYLKKSDFTDGISLIVMDVSFISQTLIYPAAADIIEENGIMVTLVKPQFELDRQSLSRNGIVNDPKGKYFEKIKAKILSASRAEGFELIDIIKSPIEGGDGNREYLAYFKKSRSPERHCLKSEGGNIPQPQ